LALGGTLAGVLESRGEGARMLVASFFRADGQVRRIAIETGKPLRDPVMIEKLFRERLDALADPLDPGFGFDLIRLESSRTERCESETAALTDTNEDKEISFLIDRLAACCDSGLRTRISRKPRVRRFRRNIPSRQCDGRDCATRRRHRSGHCGCSRNPSRSR
jgi:protein ImuB